MARLSARHSFRPAHTAAFVTPALFVFAPGQVAGVALQGQPRARLQLPLRTLPEVLPSAHLSQLRHGNQPLQSNTRWVGGRAGVRSGGPPRRWVLNCANAWRRPSQMCPPCVPSRTTAWCAGSRTAARRCTAPRRASFRLGSSSSAGWCPSGWSLGPTRRHTSPGRKERTSRRTSR